MTEKTIDRPGPGVRSAVDVANERSFLQWAGWSGLVGTLAFVTTIVAAQVSAVADPEGPGEILGYLEEVSQSGWNTYTYGIAGIVLTVLYIPMAVGVYRLLARSTAAWYGSASVVIGLAVLFPAYVINLLVPAGLVPLAADMGGVGAEALYADYAFARAAAEVFFTGASLSLVSEGRRGR